MRVNCRRIPVSRIRATQCAKAPNAMPINTTKSWKLLFINVNYAFSFQLFRGHGHCVLIRSHFKSMLQPFWLVFSAPTSTHSMHTIEIKIKHFFGLFFSLGFSFTSVALNTINFNSLKIYDRQFIIISLLGWWRSVRKFCAPFNKLLSATNIHSDNYYYCAA